MARKSKNRKKGRKGISLSCPGPWASSLIMAALLALIYLWVGGQCESLGREIGELEQVRTQLSQQLNLEKSRWARNETMEGILRGLARWDIRMELPEVGRVVVVPRRDLLKGDVSNNIRQEYAMMTTE